MRAGLDSSPDEVARARWLVSVSSTCSLWRQIALSTPRLWNHVAFYLFEDDGEMPTPDPATAAFIEQRVNQDYDMAGMFFRRAGALKLHLTIVWSSLASLPRGLSRFTSLLTAHSHRIQSIIWHGQCAPDRLPGIHATLPPSLSCLTSLEIRTEIIDVSPEGVPRLFPTFQHLESASGGNIVDLTVPWDLGTLQAPKLRSFTCRTYVPTPALAAFVARCEELETLGVSFESIPERDQIRKTRLSSSSVRQILVGGDMWACDVLLGDLPSLETLKTIPHDVVSPDDLSMRPPDVLDDPRLTLYVPSLRNLDLKPYAMYSDEDLDFILAHPKLRELDLRDCAFPAFILESLVAPDPQSAVASPRSRRSSVASTSSCSATPPKPCSPAATSPPVPSPPHPSTSRRVSPSPPPASPPPTLSTSSSFPSSLSSTSAKPSLSPSPLSVYAPNPALRTLRLYRSRSIAGSEDEWRQMVVLAQTLLMQRPSLSVHFIGAGTNDLAWFDPLTRIPYAVPVPVLRCDPELFVLSRLFGDRVWITTDVEDAGVCGIGEDDGALGLF